MGSSVGQEVGINGVAAAIQGGIAGPTTMAATIPVTKAEATTRIWPERWLSAPNFTRHVQEVHAENLLDAALTMSTRL